MKIFQYYPEGRFFTFSDQNMKKVSFNRLNSESFSRYYIFKTIFTQVILRYTENEIGFIVFPKFFINKIKIEDKNL